MARFFGKVCVLWLPVPYIKIFWSFFPCQVDLMDLCIKVKPFWCFCFFNIIFAHKEVVCVIYFIIDKSRDSIFICCRIHDLFIFMPDKYSFIILDIFSGI